MRQVLFWVPIKIPGWLPNGIPLYGFGVMLFVAFFVGLWLASRRAVKEGVRKELIQDLALWLLIGGIVGGRLAGAPLSEFLWFWEGGLVLYGAIIGALVAYALAYFLLVRRQHVPTWKLADIMAPSLALGIGIGRFGCLLNGCCFGNVACPDCFGLQFPLSGAPRYTLVEQGLQTAAGFTMNQAATDQRNVGSVAPDSAAAASGLRPGDVIVQVDDQKIDKYAQLEDYLGRGLGWRRGKNTVSFKVERGGKVVDIPPFAPHTLKLQPTQLYESISMFLLTGLLISYFPFRRQVGEVTALLMIGYGIHRSLNELLRGDPRPIGFERYISLFLIAAGILFFVWFRYSAASLIKTEGLAQGQAKSPRPSSLAPRSAV
jgi:phosphatidylglycerol:prolipoprotein diacylglycerol transferase